ncbi:MAG: hypothetical protein ACK40G_03900 [Cytophagaceae bacterium]
MPPLEGNYNRYKFTYQGKNLYFQNPYTEDMKTFCTKEVWVNGKRVLGYQDGSAFEVDLSYFNLDDTVEVIVFQHASCKVKVLGGYPRGKNPFAYNFFKADEKESRFEISWKSKKPFTAHVYLERFQYNIYTIIDSLINIKPDTVYTFNPKHLSGINKCRLKTKLSDGQVLYSHVEEFISSRPKIKPVFLGADKRITFNASADYEILNTQGEVIMSGTADEISLQPLEAGIYYLLVDNRIYKMRVSKDKLIRKKG